MWGAGPRLSLDDVAQRSGLDRALISRAWRASGFPDPDAAPDPRVFTERDVELFGIVRAGVDYFGEEVTLQIMRVLGAAAGRLADAAISAFMVNVVPSLAGRETPALALAQANMESLALLDGMTQGFDVVLRHYIERGFRPFVPGTSFPDVDLVRRSVGFADLVDSTAWTQQLELPALARALSEFDAVASEVVARHEGRVVKLLGDEVMFVTVDAADAAEIALELVDVFATHAVLPPVRAGVATGAVLARDGDFSGAVVNLAARAVKLAAPSSVLVDHETRAALADLDRFTFAAERGRTAKGFAAPVPLSRLSRRA